MYVEYRRKPQSSNCTRMRIKKSTLLTPEYQRVTRGYACYMIVAFCTGTVRSCIKESILVETHTRYYRFPKACQLQVGGVCKWDESGGATCLSVWIGLEVTRSGSFITFLYANNTPPPDWQELTKINEVSLVCCRCIITCTPQEALDLSSTEVWKVEVPLHVVHSTWEYLVTWGIWGICGILLPLLLV